MSEKTHRRRVFVASAKLALALGIFAYLFYSLRGERVFARLVYEPKVWWRLAVAQGLVMLALSLNYTRWFLLVRALGLRFTLSDAFRLGSLGTLLSQVWFGSMGGDLFKAVAVAREQAGKRTEAVASVVIDRVVGMYAMLVVGSGGLLIAGEFESVSPEVRSLSILVMSLAAAGTVGVALLMAPAAMSAQVAERLHKLPAVGPTMGRLFEAAAAYRHQRRYLFAAIGLACCTHTSLVMSFWMIGRGLPVAAPSLAATFVVGPLSLCAGAIPLTPGGLGTFEGAMDRLYVLVGSQKGDGLFVALTYRVMTYVMAGVGGLYYVSARKSVDETLHEAEDLAEELAEQG